MNSLFDQRYFKGHSSNYYFGYNILKYKFFWTDKILQILKYKKSGRLLDVGCAFGYFAKIMKEEGFDVYGIDVSKFAIEKCKTILNKKKFLVHDIAKRLPFKENFFDIITVFDVIEHIKDYEKTTRNLIRVLSDKGIMILSTPIRIKGILKYIAIDRDKTHISVLSEKKLLKMLKRNKLKILEKKYYLNLFGLVIIPINTKLLGTSILVVCRKTKI